MTKHRIPSPVARLLAASAIVLTAAVPATAGEWLTDPETAFRVAGEREVPLLVDLYAEWCGWCKKLDREVFSTPEFQRFTEDYVLLRVDVEDGAEGSALQDRYGAVELPTLLVLTPRNSLIGSAVGFHPTAEMTSRIRGARESYAAFEERARRVREEGDLVELQKLATAYHDRADGARARELYERFVKRSEIPAEERRWIEFLIADSLRLEGRHDEARRQFEVARAHAREAGDDMVLERLEDLAWLLGRDEVDCDSLDSLARFLEEYPKSDYRPAARRLLESRRQHLGDSCA